MNKEKLYCIDDFIYWLSKHNETDHCRYTQAQIATIVAKALINFLPETNTPY